MQNFSQATLNIKSTFEIFQAVFAIKRFFLKNFPSEINLVSNLRDFSHAAVSISIEQTAILLKTLFDKRRDDGRLDIIAEEDDFSLRFTVKASSLNQFSDNEISQLCKVAKLAGFAFELGEEIVFRADAIPQSQYLVFVRTASVIENVLSVIFEK